MRTPVLKYTIYLFFCHLFIKGCKFNGLSHVCHFFLVPLKCFSHFTCFLLHHKHNCFNGHLPVLTSNITFTKAPSMPFTSLHTKSTSPLQHIYAHSNHKKPVVIKVAISRHPGHGETTLGGQMSCKQCINCLQILQIFYLLII